MAKKHLFLASLALIAGISAPVFAQDSSADTVVANVNGVEITLGHMIAAREALPEEYKSLPNETLFTGILDQLVQQAALEQTVEGTLSRRDTLTLENSRRDFLSNIALMAVVKDAVTETALQAVYDARFAAYAPQKEFSAAHILVETEERANELKAELAGGADFAALATSHSTDVGSGANGGDLGWFGVGMMVKPFEDAVIGAEIGAVTGPVKSDFGYHLILVKETRIAEKPTLDALRGELSGELQQRAVEAHIKTVTDAAKIERFADGIDPAVLSDTSLLDK